MVRLLREDALGWMLMVSALFWTWVTFLLCVLSLSVEFYSLRPHGLYSSWNSPGQNTGVGSLSLFQGIFPTQVLDPGLLQCRWILYQLSHKGSSRILEWVTHPFSTWSSWPRNRTRVSCIAGRFFTNWGIRKASKLLDITQYYQQFSIRSIWKSSAKNRENLWIICCYFFCVKLLWKSCLARG